MKDILQQLEATYGAPASLFERSAAAKANASRSTTEAVLQEWAAEASSNVGVTEAAAPVPPAEGRGDAEERSDDAGGQPPAAGPEEGDRRQATADSPKAEPAIAEASSSSSPSGGGVTAGDGGGQTLEGAALLAAVAEARGMPESLIERSASARAKAAGVSAEEVLHEWAEEEGLEVASPEEAPSYQPPATSPEEGDRPQATADSPKAEASSSSPSGGGVAAGGGGGQALEGAALLSAVAEARGMPESLIERSAKARAKKEDSTVEAVLQEWAADAGLSAVSSQPPAASPKAEPPIAEPSSSSSPSGGGVAAGDEGGQAEKISDDPADPVPVDATGEPDPGPEPSPRSRYPAWLAAAILVIPLLAVLYLVVVPNQPSCGSAGQLAIDPASGTAVGCDGSAYGANEVSNFAVGGEIYAASCAVCHGTDGGGGAGPAMAGGVILETFPEGSCASHIEWIALGSTGWPDSTYGENGTPVAGGMPGFGGQLTDLEVTQVSLYERVEFGGLDLAAAEAECGFEPVAEEG